MSKLDLKHIKKCFFSVSFIVISFASYSQEPDKKGFGILHAWEATCHQDGCVMDAMILRGGRIAR